jgi:hypothetical protein
MNDNRDYRQDRHQGQGLTLEEWDALYARQRHPITVHFPRMSEEARDALRKSLNEHGQADPIWLLDEQIIYRIDVYDMCRELRIAPRFESYSDNFIGKPLDALLAHIQQDKQWMPAEIDIAAARLVNTTWGGDHRLSDATIDKIAERFRISPERIKAARAVIRLALPEVMAKLDEGKFKNIWQAKAIVTPTKEERQEGLTSMQKQRNWLNDPKSGNVKRGEPRPTPPITTTAIKGLSDAEAETVALKVVAKLSTAAFARCMETTWTPRYEKTFRSASRRS